MSLNSISSDLPCFTWPLLAESVEYATSDSVEIGTEVQPINRWCFSLNSFTGPTEIVAVSGKVEGSVVSISETGNLVTDISPDQLLGAPRDEQVTVRCDDHETNGIFDANHDQPAATLLAIIGSSGCVELEVVGDSAKIMLGISLGGKVEVAW